MNKIIMLVMGLLFTSRLFASIVPHASQLEHDAPILIRSVLIVGVAGFIIWKLFQYFKARLSSEQK
ncbi:membrane protein [Vibrio hyugaensis]|uniref:membrane protein n=1 Tax=Vibrio hyugaensis TaxID=1534743 RepID=UPI0005EE8B60|nr:membrane protein [Vibrio hyugaensis]